MTAAAPSLSSLRLHPLDEHRLRWFWCKAEGDLGLRSNLGPMSDRMASEVRRHHGSKPVTRTTAYEVSERQVDAVGDARAIADRLERMLPTDVNVLRAHLGPLSQLHRRLEPTHDSYQGDPRRPAARHLVVFGERLALVLHVLERDTPGKPRTDEDRHLTDEQRLVLAIEKILLVATKAEVAQGQERDAARAKVSEWLTRTEVELVRASRAYQESRR